MQIIKELKSHLGNRLDELVLAKSQGQKIIGYMPGGYFPEELVLAAGAIPVCMIRGGDHEAVDNSIAYVDRWLDPFYRGQIGYGISGKDPYYNLLDLLFVPVTDNQSRAISDIIDFHTDMDVFPFGIPHTKDDVGRRYYLHCLKKVKKKLEEITGTEITDNRLEESIRLCNRQRALMKEISLSRKTDPAPIDAKTFVMVNHGISICDKTIVVDLLESLLHEVRRNGSPARSGPRILLTGPTLAMGDDKVLDLIEASGGIVVMEEFAEGIYPYWYQVGTTGDLMEALADAYFMDRVVPAWFRPARERLDHLVQLSRIFNVSGVIWYQLMYRESYKIESHYFPEILKKETGLSMLTLESDYDPAETGQMATRIETYIESIQS